MSLEDEQAVARRLPAAVLAQNPAARLAIDRDGSHDARVDRIEHALHLDHFVRGPADEHVEARLDDRRPFRFGIAPVAEERRAVAGQVVARIGNPFAPRPKCGHHAFEEVLAQHAFRVVVLQSRRSESRLM